MAEPIAHARSSANRWGGQPEDYLAIHEKMDVSKRYIGDNRHRALTHHHFWIHEVMEPLFGKSIVNSAGREVTVYKICELHILEDFNHKFIPSAADYLAEMECKPWMNSGLGAPPTKTRIVKEHKQVTYEVKLGRKENNR